LDDLKAKDLLLRDAEDQPEFDPDQGQIEAVEKYFARS